MIVVNNKIRVQKGYADRLAAHFNNSSGIEQMQGFLGMEVLIRQQADDWDEVVIATRWRGEEHFQAWIKSKQFRAAHTHDKINLDYIIQNEVIRYDVRLTRAPEK